MDLSTAFDFLESSVSVSAMLFHIKEDSSLEPNTL